MTDTPRIAAGRFVVKLADQIATGLGADEAIKLIEEEGEGRGTDTVSKTTKPGSKTTVSTAHSTTKTKPGDMLI